MQPLTREWLEKAEADLRTARREHAVTERPNHDAVAFHAQQAAEKFIKALLCERGLHLPRTHDLLMLARLVQPPHQPLQFMLNDLEVLSQYAVQARYPGFETDTVEASRALEIAAAVRAACLGAVSST